MPQMNILCVGSLKNPSIQELFSDYLKRLSHYTRVTIQEVRDGRVKDIELNKQKESGLLIKELKPDDYVVLLDEEGDSMTSVELSQWIEESNVGGRKKIVFVIGGAYGVDHNLKKRAQLTLSLSNLTLTHELARLLLLEQLYRAHTILKGEQYHH